MLLGVLLAGLGAALVLVVALSGCARSSDTHGSGQGDGVLQDSDRKDTKARAELARATAEKPVTFDRSPVSRAELQTTNGVIATRNLEAQISGSERIFERLPDMEGACQLVGLHLLRAELFGRPGDLERADVLGAKAVALAPNDGRAYACRAKVKAALHRFDDALRDLDLAEKHAGGRSLALDVPRANIAAARGETEAALATLEKIAGSRDELVNLGLRASLLGELGRYTDADRTFTRAQATLRDTSPFPLAWLWFQQGLMWQRAGDLQRAKVLFTAAEERLPGYAPLAGHLASVFVALHEERAAIAKLRPFVTCDDPEYEGQLASLLLAGADPAERAEGARLRDHASKRYAALMRAHPEAYADHAARFWMAAGNDAKRALAAAETNLGVRPTPEAYELALGAAIDAKVWTRACDIVARAKTAEHAEVAARIAPLATLIQPRCTASGAR